MISNRQLNPYMLLGKNAKSTLENCSEEQKRLLAIECIFNNDSSSARSIPSRALTEQLNTATALKKYIGALCVDGEKGLISSQLSDLDYALLGTLSYDEKIAWAMDITFHAFSNNDLVFSNHCQYDDTEEEDSLPIILYKANKFNHAIKRLLNAEDNESYKVIINNDLGYQDLLREFPFWRIARLQEKEQSIIQHLNVTVPSGERSLVMRDARSIFSNTFCSQLNKVFTTSSGQNVSKEDGRRTNGMFPPLSVMNPGDLSPEKEKVYRL